MNVFIDRVHRFIKPFREQGNPGIKKLNKMESLDTLIQNQEIHLNELESLKRSLRSTPSSSGPEKVDEKSEEIKTTLEQIDQEIENVYRELSVLKIRRLMNA